MFSAFTISRKPQKDTNMVGLGSRIEIRTNGDHQNDQNFDPDVMERLPGQKNKVSDKFLKVLGRGMRGAPGVCATGECF